MTTTPQTATKAGLYWRRSPRVTPGIMTLDAGQLSFMTDEGLVFAAPASEVRVRFTRYSTLVVDVGGAQFEFVTGAYAGPLAPAFSERMLAEIGVRDAAETQRMTAGGAATLITGNVIGAVAAIAGNTLGRVVGAGLEAQGVVTLFKTQHQSFALAKAWAENLRAGGVSVEMQGTSFGGSQLTILAIVIPALAVVSVGTYLLVLALS